MLIAHSKTLEIDLRVGQVYKIWRHYKYFEKILRQIKLNNFEIGKPYNLYVIKTYLFFKN